MRIIGIILIMIAAACAGGYDQLHADLGVWMPSLSGINDYLKNHSGWNVEYPTTGPLITFGYRHRWESFFALGEDLTIWTTSTSVSDQPINNPGSETWYLTGNTSLSELWLTVLPQFCFGNKDGLEFFFAPEISLVDISIAAKVEGAPSVDSAATYKDWGTIEGFGVGIGLQAGGTWSLSPSLGLGATIRYATNDWQTNFDHPEIYPKPVWFGMKGLSISPRLSMNL